MEKDASAREHRIINIQDNWKVLEKDGRPVAVTTEAKSRNEHGFIVSHGHGRPLTLPPEIMADKDFNLDDEEDVAIFTNYCVEMARGCSSLKVFLQKMFSGLNVAAQQDTRNQSLASLEKRIADLTAQRDARVGEKSATEDDGTWT
jgi:hypothetical protein